MKKNLKNKIRNAFIDETPDFKQNIVSACENQDQAPVLTATPIADTHTAITKILSRIIAVAVCTVLFCAGLFFGNLLPSIQSTKEAETYVYLDVNPSITLSLDEKNVVVSCIANNEDAENIVNDMMLNGVELNTALNAIVGSMCVKGYLTTSDSSMLVSVDKKETDNIDDFLTYITDQITTIFAGSEIECSLIAQTVNVDEKLKHRACKQGISAGKMHLLDKIINKTHKLTEEDIDELSRLSIKDLNLIYTQKKDEDKPDEEKPNDKKPSGELISGTIDGIIDEDEALSMVLDEINVSIDEVSRYYISLLPSKINPTTIAYVVKIKLQEDEKTYEYEVNSQTGEVLEKKNLHDNPHESPREEH